MAMLDDPEVVKDIIKRFRELNGFSPQGIKKEIKRQYNLCFPRAGAKDLPPECRGRDSPNKCEQVLIDAFIQYNLPFKFVGNGEVLLGSRNPDFINTNGAKQVIEFLGTYWHRLFDGAYRIEHYKQYGFQCLLIWEDELRDIERVIKKVKRYYGNQDKE